MCAFKNKLCFTACPCLLNFSQAKPYYFFICCCCLLLFAIIMQTPHNSQYRLKISFSFSIFTSSELLLEVIIITIKKSTTAWKENYILHFFFSFQMPWMKNSISNCPLYHKAFLTGSYTILLITYFYEFLFDWICGRESKGFRQQCKPTGMENVAPTTKILKNPSLCITN